MNNPPKTATLLVELLAKQHETRSPHLFKQGKFTLAWRAKVGSSPFPNLETIVSAGEPCGRFDWRSQKNADNFHYEQEPPDNEDKEDTPEYFGSLTELSATYKNIPLNGYIPGSAIRGIVRAWAMQQEPAIRSEARRMLGQQDHNGEITPGRIDFLDAWPDHITPLAIDVVNPQEKFQVYHDNSEQPAPHALYTLGDGLSPITVNVAIRGVPGKVDAQEMDKAWKWTEQALAACGLGSRTASGYGVLESSLLASSAPDPSHQTQRFDFTLYTQGVEGAIQGKGRMELRPSHWRGWLRSWTLRFLLGVMSETNARIVLEGLFGTIESTQDGKHRKGCVKVQLLPKQLGQPWGELSKQKDDTPDFYIWEGQIQISAPVDVLEPILLPIIKIAVSVGAIGRGWRRPLHFFVGKDRRGNPKKYSRGAYLTLSSIDTSSSYQMPLKSEQWNVSYDEWVRAVHAKWPESGTPNPLNAEVFSRTACAIYALPGPTKKTIDLDGTLASQATQRASIPAALARGGRPKQQTSGLTSDNGIQRSETIQWTTTSSTQTRGRGMNLIYATTSSEPPRNYKRNPNVGGKAAGGPKSSFCSWVSIRRIDESHLTSETECQEIVCLFLGKQGEQGFHRDRYQFLRDLGVIEGSQFLFGVQAPSND